MSLLTFRSNPLAILPLLLAILSITTKCAQVKVAPATVYNGNSFQCWVDDPSSCDKSKKEVCSFLDGTYKCACPDKVSRGPDGRCTLYNECAKPADNDCDQSHSTCLDLEDGYRCECKKGCVDVSADAYRPGRICRPTVNECAEPYKYDVDCHKNADCIDTEEAYNCKCTSGYEDISAELSKLPGRKCVKMIDECANGSHDCAQNAICLDQKEGFFCKCKPGFVDISSNIQQFPGRQCIQPVDNVKASPNTYYGTPSSPGNGNAPAHEPDTNTCDPLAPSCGENKVCITNAYGVYSCQCGRGSVNDNGKCRVFNHCDRGNDCDPSGAICSNQIDKYICQCKPGYQDESSDAINKPGRSCKKYVNECEGLHACDPHATCYDLPSGYECKCKASFVDVSSTFSLLPGRKCSASGNECSDSNLNSCDVNSSCIDLEDGYTCVCAPGYADVSGSAKLPPGRVCTLQTTCPAQPSDLVFVVDGSGSIGGDTFKEEVLRFLKDFVELFDINKEQTRVGFVQYSDQIRHEFDLGKHGDRSDVVKAISNTEYLTGLTRTGQVIEHVVENVYNENNGARPAGKGVSRIVIVITDGRSQDNVTIPAAHARDKKIQMFAVGVTEHVLDKELLEIANNRKDRVFKVEGFKELNNKLRAAIQKVACTDFVKPPPSTYNEGACDVATNRGCPGALNQVCKLINGLPTCVCPEGFERNQETGCCGGKSCNPDLASSCPEPEVCKLTPHGNHLCSCPEYYGRDTRTGTCITPSPPKLENPPQTIYTCDKSTCSGQWEECIINDNSQNACGCKKGFERNSRSGKCTKVGSCDPGDSNSCSSRKKEKCLPDPLNLGSFSCQCPPNAHRDQVTQVCLVDECFSKENTCSINAECTDTLEGYLCQCKQGYRDISPNIKDAPGRVCDAVNNECLSGTHNCSTNAICTDITIGFICRCKEGFIDFSPNPRQFGGVVCLPMVDECSTPELNNCHKHANCIDTNSGFECKCKSGYVDRIPFSNVGRDCKKVNDICETGKHTCSSNARCVESGDDDYKCICNVGFIDKSGPGEKPGTKCFQQICNDRSKFDCAETAICIEDESFKEKYTCKCRDGYVEDDETNPGRKCNELVNECLNGDNTCDQLAVCTDLPKGYTCKCPAETKDISPDLEKLPGRKCFPLVNECNIIQLNNCSKFATCEDTETSFKCTCNSGYLDQNLKSPGTDCKFIINECEQSNLNDCSKNAICKDTVDSYTCECKTPYKDESPSNPGRVCKFNECADSSTNDCDRENADCIDTDDSYICRCKDGFYDNTNDPTKSGRECLKFVTKMPPQSEPQQTTPDPNLVPCGNTHCKLNLGEVCLGGNVCSCKPGEGRDSETSKCVPVTETPITLRIVQKEDENEAEPPKDLKYSSEYGSKTNPSYVDVADRFVKGLGKTIQQTPSIAPKFIGSSVNFITNPKVENSTWDNGLLINGTVSTSDPVDKCLLFKEIEEALNQNNLKLGSAKLVVAGDFGELNPCKPPPVPKGIPCGENNYCKQELGEICIANKLCACPSGYKRRMKEDGCVAVESINFPLWINREGTLPIKYNPSVHANPLDEENKRLTHNFESGIGNTFDNIPGLNKNFLGSEVNDIENPKNINGTWDHGIIYNFTSYFTKGSVDTPKNIFTQMFDWIHNSNKDEVGKSNQFINPNSPNPFDSCYNNKCHASANCVPNGGRGYTCSCPSNFKDLDLLNPGHNCVSLIGYNECLRKEDNICDAEHARCIDLNIGYECTCKIPYVNAAKKGEKAGSVCRLDFCSDVNYCPTNSTCTNTKDEAVCKCNPDFLDLKGIAKAIEASGGSVNKKYLLHGSEGDLVIAPVKEVDEKESKASIGNTDVLCVHQGDVNECALGLHTCPTSATCIDLKKGYTCQCAEGYTDGNPSNPGRSCAALLCGLCNGHGDCITSPQTGNITCSCAQGWKGETCAEAAGSTLSTILMILLALLLLLLALLCCLYLCLRTRCFGGGGAMSQSSGDMHQDLMGSENMYTIPRAKLGAFGNTGYGNNLSNADALERYMAGDDSSSMGSASIIEEIERKVITDVSTKEIITTRTEDANGESHEETTVIHHPSSRNVNYGENATNYAAGQSSAQHGSSSAQHGDEESDSDTEYFDDHKVDKTTKVTNERGIGQLNDGFEGEFERRKTETSSKVYSEEKNFY
uniref:Transmembrane matrix receptor MUP-4 n=1 Tax=Rhabditophanes sp. KR3021 TaxID=114890 RepID=A0AC35UCE3_9BILA